MLSEWLGYLVAHRQHGVERRPLEGDGHCGPPQAPEDLRSSADQLLASQSDAASSLGRLDQACQAEAEGGLTRAALTHYGQRVTTIQLEAHTPQRVDLAAEAHGEVVHL
jgi:hypothetical protein